MNENTGGYEAAQREGTFSMPVHVNAKTGIVCVGLPFYDPSNPMEGAKPARVCRHQERISSHFLTGRTTIGTISGLWYRQEKQSRGSSHVHTAIWVQIGTENPEAICATASRRCQPTRAIALARRLKTPSSSQESVLKLLTGMCGDRKPLNFRGPYENDRVTPDPYYKVAPNWSTLSGGRHPIILLTPNEFVPKLINATSCVPFIHTINMYIVEADGTKTEISEKELIERNIKVQIVPNLHARPSSGSAQSPTSPAPPMNLSPIINRQEACERSIDKLTGQLDEIKALIIGAAKNKDCGDDMAATSDASGPSSSPESEPPAPPATGPGKRARRS